MRVCKTDEEVRGLPDTLVYGTGKIRFQVFSVTDRRQRGGEGRNGSLYGFHPESSGTSGLTETPRLGGRSEPVGTVGCLQTYSFFVGEGDGVTVSTLHNLFDLRTPVYVATRTESWLVGGSRGVPSPG